MKHITYVACVELVREVFPDATEKRAKEILWLHTGFPAFWRHSPKREIRAALRVLKKTLDAGKVPCDFCNKPVMKGDTVCGKCAKCLE